MKYVNQYTDSCLFFILDVNVFQWSVHSTGQIQNNLLSERARTLHGHDIESKESISYHKKGSLYNAYRLCLSISNAL